LPNKSALLVGNKHLKKFNVLLTAYRDISGSCQQPVNITHDYTSHCLYRVDPPDDEQQACLKHVETYYRHKLIENSASCWFMLRGSEEILLKSTLK